MMTKLSSWRASTAALILSTISENRDHRLVRPVAAALLGHLILHVDGNHPAALEGANGGDVETPPQPVSMSTRSGFFGRGRDNALGVDQQYRSWRSCRIRQAEEGGVRRPGAGEEGLEARCAGHQRHER